LVNAEDNLVAINLVAELQIFCGLSWIFIKECLTTLFGEILIARVEASRSTSNFIWIFDSGIFASVILDQLHVETS